MKNLFLITGFSLFFLACAPDPTQDLTIEETDIVITRPSPTHDYQQDSLFVILDFVLELKPDTIIQSNDALDSNMVQEVREQMLEYGYKETDTNNINLNVALVLTKFVDETTAAVNGGYWAGYPGYWNPWYTGYPGTGWYYPGYTYVYSFETGSVIIAMFDWSTRNEQVQIPIWEGGLRGVLAGNNSGSSTRVLWGIDQAFNQSPYLDHN